MRPTSLATFAALATLTVATSGCFNDAFQTNKGVDKPFRFEVLIGSGRTAVYRAHLLVDRATGDLWRLDASDAQSASWVRLADGPSDAALLSPDGELEDDDS
jgi:hypothetical protein